MRQLPLCYLYALTAALAVIRCDESGPVPVQADCQLVDAGAAFRAAGEAAQGDLEGAAWALAQAVACEARLPVPPLTECVVEAGEGVLRLQCQNLGAEVWLRHRTVSAWAQVGQVNATWGWSF
jgi:hypothetical protein